MIVLVAGAHGRLGSRVLALLLGRGHAVRALVRTQGQADALETVGAQPVLADLRGDVEWTADGCEAAVFAVGARHRSELPAIDAGGAAEFAEAAEFELRRFVLCSAVGAGWPSGGRGRCASSWRPNTTPNGAWSVSTCPGRSSASAG